ncbi:uncharacterized protein VP01_11684g1, partial [Puccinia sorghi]
GIYKGVEAGDNPPVGKPLASPRGALDILILRNTSRKHSKAYSESKVKTLVMDVKNQWISTYLILNRALELMNVCKLFCNCSEASRYSLTEVEWEKFCSSSAKMPRLWGLSTRTGVSLANLTIPQTTISQTLFLINSRSAR